MTRGLERGGDGGRGGLEKLARASLPMSSPYEQCGTLIWMKAIQVTFDEELLEQLDERPEVRERGRSRILREMTAAYLAEKRSEDIAREYREGYTKYPQTDEEIEWAGHGVWPEE